MSFETMEAFFYGYGRGRRATSNLISSPPQRVAYPDAGNLAMHRLFTAALLLTVLLLVQVISLQLTSRRLLLARIANSILYRHH